MEASFWRRLWTCRQTEYWMNEFSCNARSEENVIRHISQYICSRKAVKYTARNSRLLYSNQQPFCRSYVPVITPTWKGISNHSKNKIYFSKKVDFHTYVKFIFILLLTEGLIFHILCPTQPKMKICTRSCTTGWEPILKSMTHLVYCI